MTGRVDPGVWHAARAFAVVGCLVVTLLGAGCGGMPLESTPPAGFDLNGEWHLLPGSSDPPPSSRRLRERGSRLAFITQDFPILRARELRIEQSRDSMGVRYDGADYRDVSWGTRTRGLWEVRTGWNEGNLVIVSKAKDADAREIITLSADGRQLQVDVRIESRGDDISLIRTFQRR